MRSVKHLEDLPSDLKLDSHVSSSSKVTCYSYIITNILSTGELPFPVTKLL